MIICSYGINHIRSCREVRILYQAFKALAGSQDYQGQAGKSVFPWCSLADRRSVTPGLSPHQTQARSKSKITKLLRYIPYADMISIAGKEIRNGKG